MQALSAEKFAEREAAQERLLQWAENAPEKSAAALLKQSQEAEDPEIRSRCREALKAFVIGREYRADGFLGIGMQEVEVKLPGGGPAKAIRVTRVIDNSSAGQVGITEGALIVGLGTRMWKEGDMALEFREQVKRTRPGTMLTLLLLENGAIITKELKLGERPPQEEGTGEEDLAKANEAAKEEFFRRWLNKRTKQHR